MSVVIERQNQQLRNTSLFVAVFYRKSTDEERFIDGYFLLKKSLCILFETKCDRNGGRIRDFPSTSLLPNCSKAGAGPGQSQKPGTRSSIQELHVGDRSSVFGASSALPGEVDLKHRQT